jgi:hypothetical protein
VDILVSHGTDIALRAILVAKDNVPLLLAIATVVRVRNTRRHRFANGATLRTVYGRDIGHG